MVKTKSQSVLKYVHHTPRPLPEVQLPTKLDVLLDYYYQKSLLSSSHPNDGLMAITQEKIITLYEKIPLKYVSNQQIKSLLSNLIKDYGKVLLKLNVIAK